LVAALNLSMILWPSRYSASVKLLARPLHSFVGHDERIHKLTGKGRQRDDWICTPGGLKMKYHEELESNVQMEENPF
jgi:hypothetical protein